ncbi:carboxylating nicotinate-nucleotide diphosphorylase [Methanocaldococcus indicus]|uniref:carboxylating nicotinate-nucleotide diphosphorylase n=1 Tax=Methanocaldococcus indicus TaxID=213231 RepID=UPI003C6CEC1D
MLKNYALKVLNKSLEQDIGFFDVSTEIFGNKEGRAIILAKEKCVLCGIDFIKEFFESYNLKCKKLANDGDLVFGEILEIEGKIKDILLLERTALNFLMHLSGVSTKTYNIIQKVREVNKNVRIAGTRKTLPLLAPLQKYAIYIAGGDTHRFRLDDCIMIKDNHIKAFGMRDAIKKVREKVSFTKKIEVEVNNFTELKIALEEKVDIVMLDNFKPKDVCRALNIINNFYKETSYRPIVEVSGGINEDNILEYAKYKVDVISLGCLTHSVKAVDMSLDIV